MKEVINLGKTVSVTWAYVEWRCEGPFRQAIYWQPTRESKIARNRRNRERIFQAMVRLKTLARNAIGGTHIERDGFRWQVDIDYENARSIDNGMAVEADVIACHPHKFETF